MRLKDAAIKRQGADLWLYHTASPYKVRINETTVVRLAGLLRRKPGETLNQEESFLLAKLQAKGMLEEADSGEAPRVKDKSPLDSIELEFSGTCNLACRHCFARMSGAVMGAETFAKVLAGARELDVLSMVFSGGEPLLNPLFSRALDEARRAGLKAILMTNASAVTEELARRCKAAGLAEAVVSLDGREEHHDRLRGQGAFAAAARGIRLLAGHGVPVYVTAMVTDRSFPELEGFESFCLKELGARGVRLSAVVPLGRAAAMGPELRLSDKAHRQVFADGCPDEDGAPPATGRAGFKCSAGRGQVFVSADGKVYACHYFQNLDELIGDLGRESLAEAYRRNMREGISCNFERAALKSCLACRKYSACLGGCRARAKLLGKAWEAVDPVSCRIHGVAAPS